MTANFNDFALVFGMRVVDHVGLKLQQGGPSQSKWGRTPLTLTTVLSSLSSVFFHQLMLLEEVNAVIKHVHVYSFMYEDMDRATQA